jgi:hypothetical protein
VAPEWFALGNALDGAHRGFRASVGEMVASPKSARLAATILALAFNFDVAQARDLLAE